MDPRLFLETAESLLSSDHEADCRSAVSRAYYSSFLVARDLVEVITNQRLTNFDTHKSVRDSLKNSSTPQGRTLSIKLAALHSKRKVSDYELGTSVNYEDADNAIGQAEEIIKLLDTVLSTPNIYLRMQTAMVQFLQNDQEEV